jgi:hypothetical protein
MQAFLSVPPKSVRQAELKSLSKVSGSRFRLLSPELCDDDAVLRGDFRQLQLRPGLALHCTDTHELYDLKTEAVQRSGITISLFLRGGVTAWIAAASSTWDRRSRTRPRSRRSLFRARGRNCSHASRCEGPISAR